MNKFFPILILTMASLAFSSCEKVIEIDLADSKSVIVIEATITSNKEPFTVLVSKTSSYFGASSSSDLVSGAIVSVRVENGKSRYFSESSPGVYTLDKTFAQSNYWYIVNVEYEGITYSARSYLNEMIPIADISLSYFDGFGIFDSGYKVNCFIRDPAGVDNYYRMKIYVNGQLSNDGEINLYSDKLFDGKLIGLVQQSAVFKETDTITVELQSIDEATYTYFSTLKSITGKEAIQSASPANPTSNFDNDALGYFSAYSFDRKILVVSDFIGE